MIKVDAETLLEEGAFAGFACGFVKSDMTVFRSIGGFRQKIPSELPMTFDTCFDMASISKILGPAMIALSLHHLRELDFDTKLSKLLPRYGNFGEATILNLLTHSAGFLSELPLWKTASDPSDLYSQILKSEPQYRPGKSAIYSCLGYIILGYVLSIITGENLDVLGRELVWSKIGMHDTGYNPASGYKFAATERKTETGNVCWSGIVHDENARFLRPVPSGNAGIFSTLDDMLLFARFILNELKSPSFFSEEEVALISSDLTLFSPVGRSVGFMMHRGYESNGGYIAGPESFGHTGFTGTSIWFSPHLDAAVVLLSNRIHPDRNNLILRQQLGEFHDTVFGTYGEIK